MKTLILVAALSSLTLAAAAPAQAAGLQLLPFGFKFKPGMLVSLNPQPLPPGGETSIIIVGGKGGEASLNPQPLPPGGENGIIIVSGRGTAVSLNPQPLPPKESFGSLVSLNPQPLPPKELFSTRLF